jgi:excisionase family DNA binding protein
MRITDEQLFSLRDRVVVPVGKATDPVLLFDTAMPADSDPAVELLTVAEAARLLRISVSGVRRLQQARRIPFVKVGGSVRFNTRDLAAYVRSNRVESIGQ